MKETGTMKTALIVADVQNDFCHGGTLAVRNADEIVEPVNRLIALAARRNWRVFVTRDWHPRDHISFRHQGGIWPPHCIVDSQGAAFHPALNVPADATLVSKATLPQQEAYSAFEGTNLRSLLVLQGVYHVVLAGLTTDYCIKNTALDALRFGFGVTVVEDVIRAVNLKPADGPAAVAAMKEAGALMAPLSKFVGGAKPRSIETKRVVHANKPVARKRKGVKAPEFEPAVFSAQD
jgi:nicotinamidase/pyrazinamidase